MRKFLLSLFLSVLLVACSNNEILLQEKYETYKLHYQSILNTTQFKNTSDNFSISSELTRLSDGSYRYDVYVDEPRIAMYDVEILVIVDDGLLLISDEMMPSIGIYEDSEYYLIPYQINSDLGYQKGFNLNGIVSTDTVNLKVLVMWKDYFKIKTEREYFSFDLPPVVQEEEVVEATE
jgi:hypothetical protein